MTTINPPIPTTGGIPETGGNYLSFAKSLLQTLGAPDTPDNEAALVTWMWAEQSGQPNAAFNPLNIQAGDYPHVSLSSGGQYNFADWGTGVQQTAAFLQQGAYSGIVAALQAGNNAANVLSAVQDSPWAGGHYGYQLVGDLANTLANFSTVGNGSIAGATATGGVGPLSGVTGTSTATLTSTSGDISQFLQGIDPTGLSDILGGILGASGAGGISNPLPQLTQLYDLIGAVAAYGIKSLKFLTTPHNWVRIGFFVGGGILLFVALGIINKDTIGKLAEGAAVAA